MAEKIKIELNAVDNASGVLDKVSANVQGFQTRLQGAVGASTAFAGALTGIGVGLGFLAKQGLAFSADMETAERGLAQLLGSAEEASKTVERIKKEAARTPFEVGGLTRATQLLSAVTKDGNKSVEILLDVGESLAAMGKGQAELDRIIVNLQQIGALGRASSLDIKQFAFAGIPIYEMLAETTGLAKDKLGEFIEEGGVTFELLTEMFKKATDEGGQFFGAFEAQGGSMNQLLSNLKDTWNVFLSEIVISTGLFDLIKNLLLKINEQLPIWGERIKAVIDFFREHEEAIIIVAGVIMGALLPAIYAMIVAFAGLAVSLAPFMLGGLIIGALVAGIYWIVTNYDMMRDKIMAVWNSVADFLKGVWDRITGIFQSALDVIMGIVDRFLNAVRTITSAASSIGNVIGSAGKKVGGILGFASGGIVPGRIGQPQLAVVHGGEQVIPAQGSGFNGGGININITGNNISSELDMSVLAEKVGKEVMRSLRLAQVF